MLLTPSQMITDLRDWIDEPTEGYWTNPELMRRINNAQGRCIRDISQQDSSYFIATTQIDFVADQALYDLPRNAPLGARWDHIANLDANGRTEKFVYDFRLRDRVIGDLVTNPGAGADWRATFQGNQLRITPKPSVAESNAIEVVYIPIYGDLHEGTVSSAATTTLVFPAAPLYSAFGAPSVFDDQYNGMEIVITAGTGVGQRRTISDYAGSTRTVTVTAWTTTPDDTSTYALVSPVPEDFHDVNVLRAALDAATKSPRRRQQEIAALLTEKNDNMLTWVRERQVFRKEAVYPDLSTGVF